MRYRDAGEVTNGCTQCLAWKCEVERVSLLLELLAEDRFPDQETFDVWMAKQITHVLKPRKVQP